MGRIGKFAVSSSLAAGAAYAAYRLLLDDHARENLRQAASNVSRVVTDVAERAYAASGLDITQEHAERTSDRASIDAQWESLGF